MAVPTIDLASFRVALQALPEERQGSASQVERSWNWN